jgi:hypothetical protein
MESNSRAGNDPPFAIKTRLLIATVSFELRFDLLPFRVSLRRNFEQKIVLSTFEQRASFGVARLVF